MKESGTFATEEGLAKKSEIGENLKDAAKRYNEKIKSAKNLSDAERKAFKRELGKIVTEHWKKSEEISANGQKEAARLTRVFIEGEVSSVEIGRQALNTALTASGLMMFRGGTYGLSVIAERAKKANLKFERGKIVYGAEAETSRLRAMAKDLTINAARETWMALRGDKEERGATRWAKRIAVGGKFATFAGIALSLEHMSAAKDLEGAKKAIQEFTQAVGGQGIGAAAGGAAQEGARNLFIENPARILTNLKRLAGLPGKILKGEVPGATPKGSQGKTPGSEEIRAPRKVVSPSTTGYVGAPKVPEKTFLKEIQHDGSLSQEPGDAVPVAPATEHLVVPTTEITSEKQ
ncbi:MAG: hypothetical protein AAB967_02200, partial [Patescibacteria group bacterium]